ncbi:MAG: hypothetical protein WC069_06220 [Candidatus Shapirobacteria bacterium]
MATQATYIGVTPRTIIADSTAIARGIRVTRAAGVCAAAAVSVRGDFVTATSIEASKPGEAFSLQSAGKVPMLASEITAVDDPAYSAADGKTSKTSGGGAIYLGKWTTVTAADALGEVELANPA